MHNPKTLIERHAFTLFLLTGGKTYAEIGASLRIRMPEEVRSTSNFNAGQNAVKALLQKFGCGSGNEAISAGFRYGFVFWASGHLHYGTISLTPEEKPPSPAPQKQLELPLIVGNGNVRASRIAGWRSAAIA